MRRVVVVVGNTVACVQQGSAPSLVGYHGIFEMEEANGHMPPVDFEKAENAQTQCPVVC